MKNRKESCYGIHKGTFRLILTVLSLTILFTSASAAFSEKEPWIAVIEKNGDSIYFSDHNENLTEGGWIFLSGGNEIQLPQPLSFTYNGAASLKGAGASLELKQETSGDNTEIALTYPYTAHPFYTEKDKVNIDYKGPAAFGQNKVNIYLIEGLDLNSFDDVFTLVRDENSERFKEIFDGNTNSTTLLTTLTLDKNGDLPSALTLDPLSAGSYGVLVMLADDEKSQSERKILSATYFEVLEYELKINSPNNLKECNNLDISLDLKKTPAKGNYTYGALLIREDAYRAEINVSSNGTREGTEIFVNGIDIVDEFDINSTNYESKFSKNELTTEIQTLIGEGNGTISIGDENQKTLSLTTFDLPPGDYLLFAGAYEKDKGLVGIAQTEVSIKEAKKSNGQDKTQKSNTDSLIENQKLSTLEAEQPVLEASMPLGLQDLEPQIRGSIQQAATVVKDPPKLPSFLIGFMGTLLIGLAIIRRTH